MWSRTGLQTQTGWRYIAERKKDKMTVYLKGLFKESVTSGFHLTHKKVVIYQNFLNPTLLKINMNSIPFSSITTTATSHGKIMQDKA